MPTQLTHGLLIDWFQSGIIPRKSYIKIALTLEYGRKLENLIDKRRLIINSTEVAFFCSRYSIEKEEGYKSLLIDYCDVQASLLELTEKFVVEAVVFNNSAEKTVQLELLPDVKTLGIAG